MDRDLKIRLAAHLAHPFSRHSQSKSFLFIPSLYHTPCPVIRNGQLSVAFVGKVEKVTTGKPWNVHTAMATPSWYDTFR